MGKYFNIGDAWSDLKNSYGVADTAMSAIKLVGKGVANTAVFGATEVVPAVFKSAVEKSGNQIEDKLKNDNSLTQEERDKLINQKNISDSYLKIQENKEEIKKIERELKDESVNMNDWQIENLEKKKNSYKEENSDLGEIMKNGGKKYNDEN